MQSDRANNTNYDMRQKEILVFVSRQRMTPYLIHQDVGQ